MRDSPPIVQKHKIGVGSDAFVLVELLIVVMIMGTLVGGAVLAFRDRQREYALEYATRDLANAIDFAASLHHHTKWPTRVQFDETFGSYWIEQRSNGTAYLPLRGRAGIDRRFPSHIRIEEMSSEGKAISPLLRSLPFEQQSTFEGTIRLRGNNGRLGIIEVASKTGQVYAHVE